MKQNEKNALKENEGSVEVNAASLIRNYYWPWIEAALAILAMKDGAEIKGYHFIINVEKSRFVKEKSKIPISVSWEGGIQTWSGLLDIAVDGGYVHKGKKGRSLGYFHMNPETGEVDEKAHYERETMNGDFWRPIFENTNFKEYIRKRYQIAYKSLEDPEADKHMPTVSAKEELGGNG